MSYIYICGIGTVVPKDTSSTPFRHWFPGHKFPKTVVLKREDSGSPKLTLVPKIRLVNSTHLRFRMKEKKLSAILISFSNVKLIALVSLFYETDID